MGKMSQFKDENEVKAFLYKVVQNSCIDLIRHEAVAQKYVQHVNSEDTEEKSFLDNILETEIFQALRIVFNELPPACKEVYLLSLQGKSHEEISQQLDITINTVKKHKNNANHYMQRTPQISTYCSDVVIIQKILPQSLTRRIIDRNLLFILIKSSIKACNYPAHQV